MSANALPDRLRAAIADAEPVEALGALEQLRAELWARLTAPPNGPGPEVEEYLTPGQAAERLKVDPRWVYRHARKLGGVRLSDRTLRFTVAGIDRYAARRRL